VIAIDGPAASGKSSTAAAVARELGALHLDSGALYRALAVVYFDEIVGVEGQLPQPEQVLRGAERRRLELREAGGALVPFLDGRDAEPLLRSREVDGFVSELSSWPVVRQWVNARLRAAARDGQPLVLDGRDIGTIVFPDAAVKLFLTATPEARARRRLLQQGEVASPEAVAREAAVLKRRDALDSSRAVAPLRRADDAVLLDTTELAFEEQVGRIVRIVRERLPRLQRS
jgi:cytidylate kinase